MSDERQQHSQRSKMHRAVDNYGIHIGEDTIAPQGHSNFLHPSPPTLVLLVVLRISTLRPDPSSTPERFGGGFKAKPEGEPGLGASLDTRRGPNRGDGRPFMDGIGPRPGDEGTGAVGERGAMIPSETSRRRERGRMRGR